MNTLELIPMLPSLWQAFDSREIFAAVPGGSWEVDETVMRISDEGL